MTIMNKYQMIIAVVAMAGFSACTSEEAHTPSSPSPDGGQLPISLGSTLGDATRGYSATNLLNGDTVYVWADMINPASQQTASYFNAWRLRANGMGSLAAQPKENGKLFPATNSLDFYALCGNFGREVEGARAGEPMIEDEITELPTDVSVRHTVLSNQSTPEGYYKSDLLYAVVKSQEPISQAVVLPFKHLLSRIQVVLVAGNGMNSVDLRNAQVRLLNLKRQITFTPNRDADFSLYADLVGMLSIPAGTSQGDILMSTNSVDDSSEATAAGSTVYADAIVVPQTIEKGANFIKVSYLGQDTYYRIPNGDTDEPLVFESGKQYRFRLIADRLGTGHLFDAVTVEEWGANSTTGLWFDNITD